MFVLGNPDVSFVTLNDTQIFRLSLLGYTQAEIGKIFGLTQTGISKIMRNFTSKLSHIQTQFYNEGKSAEDFFDPFRQCVYLLEHFLLKNSLVIYSTLTAYSILADARKIFNKKGQISNVR